MLKAHFKFYLAYISNLILINSFENTLKTELTINVTKLTVLYEI